MCRCKHILRHRLTIRELICSSDDPISCWNTTLHCASGANCAVSEIKYHPTFKLQHQQQPPTTPTPSVDYVCVNINRNMEICHGILQ